jgi:hypothetical protein
MYIFCVLFLKIFNKIKLIFRKALGETNYYFHIAKGIFSDSKILKDIWHYLKLEISMTPYSEFF